ncbi:MULTISPECIES: NUDIX hydrolase [Brevibacillus]|uniref:NUDIX hydrolase n=1 Tax=Brevibacillus TaxID=55080 RepID=UPI000D10A40A|nr:MULTISPECIES: NUDIX domain-containing protein [Brevibacillus]PSJ69459.1 NTP pyrophosphohydrolase [Brevibacillus brevis]RED21214.1 8-oxo-dGTP pyrophosphatase MutT (NUDIX family) [Brevibacillus brevis]TQK73424.1 8-oxo-dGTP pyrophosphatase MutT (NUDIX family) [Brevibacillus sp. AG162]VEF90115.1 NTP pyrophosphohydrolases containing a Zn-finger, probably nucleic-acid-binding [Brevibacillus brevis]GEC92798.1 hydrolase [Brevibacillus brevis]
MREISAGGVVYQKQDTEYMLLLIEDRYGKVTLAKGKQEMGETIEETALREVLEETGVAGRLGSKLDMITYEYTHPVTGESIDKEVHYYLVEAYNTEITVQLEEINDVHWHPAKEAWDLQLQRGYRNNDSILRLAFEQLGIEV